MNWYIGQQIICVKSHSRNKVIKGKLYTLQGIQLTSSLCNCKNDLVFDVGLRINSNYTSGCTKCNIIYSTTIQWISSTLFTPIEEADISELVAILEEETISV